MNIEIINKWLDEEYGCSYTKLEELHDFYFEKYCDLKKENKQLKDNWNKLKEWASNFYNSEEVGWAGCGIRYTLEKMQELEGSDSNEI